LHTRLSGVAHYAADDDSGCLSLIRSLFPRLAAVRPACRWKWSGASQRGFCTPSCRRTIGCHTKWRALRPPSSMRTATWSSSRNTHGDAMRHRTAGWNAGGAGGQPPRLCQNGRGATSGRHHLHRIGAESVVFCRKRRAPRTAADLLAGHVGVSWSATAAESEGIIRAGPKWWRAWPARPCRKIVLTINHASGAGYYALAGQGFDPDFTLGWRRPASESWRAIPPSRRCMAPGWRGSGQRVNRFRRIWNAPSVRPKPITSAGWTRPMRRRAGTWMRSSIPSRPVRSCPFSSKS